MPEIKTPNLTSIENKPFDFAADLNALSAKPKVSTSPTITKPLVEGINTPVITPPSPSLQNGLHLTEAEKKLINSPIAKQTFEEPKQKPRPLPTKTRSGFRGLGMFIFGFLLASAVWVAIVYLEKPQGIFDFINVSRSPVVTTNSKPETVVPVASETPSQTTTTPVSSSTPENTLPIPATEPTKITQLKIISTPTGYLNVRSEPSTAGALVGKVSPGDIVTYTNKKAGWYEIVLPENKAGWVIETYIELVPSK